jgi:hypothetical protein
MRLQLEQHKQERRHQRRDEQEAKAERKYAIAREKSKAKHRGR